MCVSTVPLDDKGWTGSSHPYVIAETEDKTVYVAFRGSVDMNDWLHNTQVLPRSYFSSWSCFSNPFLV